MRSARLLCVGHALLASALLAQERTQTPRFLFSAGPTWNQDFTGLHLRGEYHLVRDGWFGLRAELGSRWTPTQSFRHLSPIDGTIFGAGQYADINLGLAATLTPLPRAAVSPYFLIGVAATQMWGNRSVYYANPPEGLPRSYQASETRGEIAGLMGLGMRMRLGDRLIQFEVRRFGNPLERDVTIGTSLRF